MNISTLQSRPATSAPVAAAATSVATAPRESATSATQYSEMMIARGKQLAADPKYPSLQDCLQIAQSFMTDQASSGNHAGSFYTRFA